MSTNFQWSIEDNNVATVDANGTVTALAVGSTKIRVMADGIIGTALSNASSIQITSPSTVNLSIGQMAPIQANILDAAGNAIPGATITYCSDDIQVADVNFNGEISATSFFSNSTTITICHGDLSQTITVNIQ